MGRWAQRRRSGGGATPLQQMVTAFRVTSLTARIRWLHPIDGNGLDFAYYLCLPSGSTASDASQIDPWTLLVTFDETIASDTQVQYIGTRPGFVTPQQVPLVPA